MSKFDLNNTVAIEDDGSWKDTFTGDFDLDSTKPAGDKDMTESISQYRRVGFTETVNRIYKNEEMSFEEKNSMVGGMVEAEVKRNPYLIVTAFTAPVFAATAYAMSKLPRISESKIGKTIVDSFVEEAEIPVKDLGILGRYILKDYKIVSDIGDLGVVKANPRAEVKGILDLAQTLGEMVVASKIDSLASEKIFMDSVKQFGKKMTAAGYGKDKITIDLDKLKAQGRGMASGNAIRQNLEIRGMDIPSKFSQPTASEALKIAQLKKTAEKGVVGVKGVPEVAIPPKEAITPQIPPKVPIVKQPTIKNFTNFESKEAPIPQLDKEASRINGLRLSGKMSAKEANKQIQEINKKKMEYAKEKGIAITKTQSGKTRIAIRKSGFYAKEEIVKAPTVDVYSQFQPPSSMSLMQDAYKLGGKFGVVYKEVWIPTKKSIVGSIETKLKFDKEFKALLKKYKFAITKENGELLSDMMEKKVKIPEKHKELVKEVRQYMDKLRGLANEIREKMGKSSIGYIENYVPHIQETSIWNQLIGDDVTITDNFDFIIPNQVKNPFAFKRLMEEMASPDRNFFSLVERYNSATAKDMHINPAIENIKAYNTVLKDKGLFKSAKYWDEYIRVGLVGKQHKIDSSISVSPLIRKGLKKWKDILNKAFLTGKVSWNIATQPLSYISLTPTEAGYKNAITAVLRMFNKGIRSEVLKQSLSLRIKSQDVLSDAIGEGREFANRIYRTRIDKWNDMVTTISAVEEQLLHQASYIAGLSRAKELGYTGEDAQMFADLVAERTQSMYNKENRALILSSDITTAAIPFQSFATELSNHAKEILTKTKGAMQLTIRERLGKLIRLLIGIWLGNQYSKALTGREKTTVGTFIPFAGETVDRLISKATGKGYTTTRSPVSQIQQIESLVKASKDYLKYGDTKRLRKLALTFGPAIFGMGGGGQLSNLVDGIIADIDEEVKNVKGKRLFKVEDLESQIKAPIFGVWSTKGGREYWEKRQGKKKKWK